MKKLIVHDENARKLTHQQREDAVHICPFNAIENKDGTLQISSGCKICKLCVKNGPKGVFEYFETEAPKIDKSLWKGIAVYIEQVEGKIHPVSLELIGKAKELAEKVNFPVYALILGSQVTPLAEELLHYNIDEIFVYDHDQLEKFLIEPYTNLLEDFIQRIHPSSILVGATTIGRSLAPRIAARMRTGLTADCTQLDIKENTDLVQIRPAFGGNIMAQINTPNHRPQLATVRYKIFDAPIRNEETSGKITICPIQNEKLKSRIKAISITKKEKSPSISDANVLVAMGRGIRSAKDMAMGTQLAELLGGEIAVTRPLVEAGWVNANKQIGLSGRTVKPKLIFTLGISGSVQFKAGMENSDCIISINNDENAMIFNACNYAVKADLYNIIPKLIEKIQEGAKANVS